METDVPPESRVRTFALKQRVRRILLPPRLWAEQAFAASSLMQMEGSPATSKVEPFCSSCPCPHRTVNLLGEFLQLSDHYVNLQIKYFRSRSQSLQGCECKSLLIQMVALDFWLLSHALFWDTIPSTSLF